MHKFTETTNRSIAWLKKANETGQLEMSPPFQRNPVWSERQKGSLIETILLEYPIPEIYMQDVTNHIGDEKHIVVDGQQRIRAVLEYISGGYAMGEEGSKWNGFYFEDLSEVDRRKIYEYKFVTRILPEMTEEQIRSIFQRINRNTVVLNAQELRHATYWGPFIKLMEELADLDYWSYFGIFSPNDRRRMLDAEYISEIAVAYLNGPQNKKTKLEDYYQLYESDFDDYDRLKNLFTKVLGEIDQSINSIYSTRFRKKSDFYTLFLVLAEHEDKLPLSSERRERLYKFLQVFGEVVTLQLSRHITSTTDFVLDYAKNVDRAASDIGARRARHRALSFVVHQAINTDDNEIFDTLNRSIPRNVLNADGDSTPELVYHGLDASEED
ncbi:DUF262 domain-containing protein [Methylobacterium sp. WL18]|uniref:DUF262 domain-containing protein n=1 Tax=Methylobacterium sp. WL18 TaxID=2603897 RepID=UPI0011CC3B97|nr:DUF262 domain-containing protein [Methylobacterium sp. WL18]TXN64069.1 DUF262 domain-containing protein [Methylobacterium sp. WL18]